MDELRDTLNRAVDANWDAQLAFFARLVAFPSTRGAEASCQDFIAAELTRRRYEVDRYTLAEAMADGTMETLPGFSPVMDTDYANNVQVVARHPSSGSGAGRSLILQGHVDVVPTGPLSLWTTPPFEPVNKDGWLHGRGAGDMKGGVSAIVFALEALRTAGLEPDAEVVVQTVTEEECTGNGALSTTARGYRADAVLIAEPTAGTITRAHVGVMWFRVKVRGIPVHVAQAQEGTNAILSAFHLLGALAAHTASLNARAATDPVFGTVPDPIKFNPGVIRGGDWASSTPAWCEVDCRISLLPGWSLAEARRGVENCVAEAARTDRFLANNPPEVEWNGFQADGYHLEPGSDAERVLAEAHQSAFGAPMEARLSTAVNDTRFYGLYKRIPALCYGARGENHHGFDERGDLGSLRTTTLSIALFIARWCGTRPLPASSPPAS